jgi:hypothetical protein
MLGAYGALPRELRELNNWCLWKKVLLENGKYSKVPYQPNGNKCVVTAQETFSSFDDCFNVLALGSYDGLGFIFTNTPYAGIDLDDPSFIDGHPNPNYQIDLDRQIKIAREFDSYSEVSPSGKGLHIIVKGSLPEGRRKNYIEIYSSGRYFTMTGKVHNNKPIGDYQELLNLLWSQMGGITSPQINVVEKDQEVSDEEIIKRATNASNGDKFFKLLSGEWNSDYQSQSEADFAFIDIVAFYTQNRIQIARIFRSSPLGKRPKAKRENYVSGMIQRSFDRQLPSIDFEGMKEALEKKLNGHNSIDSVAQRLELAAHNGLVVGSNPTAITTDTSSKGRTEDFDSSNVGSNPSVAAIPPGLLGEIAQFIYAAAPRPVPEIALAGAIGLMAGICGKAYNVSGTGLNQYILMIADSGKGKEAMASGISKLMNAAKMQVPVANDFIGPSVIASSAGLHKWLSKNSQCFVSILGEFGIKLEAMSSMKASPVQLMLKDSLLDLYHKSGFNDVYRGSAYSDQDKNSVDLSAPSFSILGESTPERFYSVLNEDMISEGLLPRFSIIEYNGIRVPSNETFAQPSFPLMEKFCALLAHCKTVMSTGKVINVEQDSEALKLTKEIDRFADKQINSTSKEVTRQLWNRAHIKTLKLAATLSVGVNPYNPVIDSNAVNWAWDLVQRDIKALSSKFEAGLIGSNSSEAKQIVEMKRVIKDYVTEPWEKVMNYSPHLGLYESKLVTYVYLNKRLTPCSAFKNDKLGATGAIKRCIQILIDSDYLREVGKVYLNDKYKTSQRAFVISNSAILTP